MSWCGGGLISCTPGWVLRRRAMRPLTLWPGSCPPSPGFAPCAILISISSQLPRYSAETPKRPEATCLICAPSRRSEALKRTGSSPPSPESDLPPMRFIAIGKRLVGLGADRAQRHRRRREADADVFDRLDLVDRDRAGRQRGRIRTGRDSDTGLLALMSST